MSEEVIQAWRVFNDGRFERCELPAFQEDQTVYQWAKNLGYRRVLCCTSSEMDPIFGLEIFDRVVGDSAVTEAYLALWWDSDTPVVFVAVDEVALARLQALYAPIVQAVEIAELNEAAQLAFFAWHRHEASERCRRCDITGQLSND